MTPKQAEAYRAAIPKGGWKEWEVPFDTDADWPKPLADALTVYRAAWRANMGKETDAMIADTYGLDFYVVKRKRQSLSIPGWRKYSGRNA